MKVTLLQLKHYIEDRLDTALRRIKELEQLKSCHNSVGMGMEIGEKLACEEILEIMKNGIEE